MKDLIAVVLIALVVTAGVVQLGQASVYSGLEPKRFSSYDDLRAFLQERTANAPYYRTFGIFDDVIMETIGAAESMPMPATGGMKTSTAPDFSQTNIQVEGVDESDIVKTDGKYIYVVSGGGVSIVDAYPAEQAQLLSEIRLDGEVENIFVKSQRSLR